jgi:RsiW-degrading membrane proteinase PrsW (M82 family)
MGLTLGLILAIIFPLLFLGMIRRLDLYQTNQFHLIWLSLGWGIVAYCLAALTNITLDISWSVDRGTINNFIAPILEELLKAVILLYIIRLPQFTYSVDGAIYGCAAGVGFAIAENFEYIIFNDPKVAILVALQRVLSANLVHASSSALAGIALGAFFLRRNWTRWMVLAFGLVMAIGQHMIFNIMISSPFSPLIAFGTVILGVGFVFAAIQIGKRQTRAWIKEKLGMDHHITRSEATLVDRLANPDKFLLPVFERFGAETASRVEKLLYLQARLGIKRKTLDSLQNNVSLRRAVEAEISKMQMEMDATRRAVGVYPMLFVRGLFTDEMVSAWEQMQIKIRERSVESGGLKGGGVWSSLEERVKSPTDTERPE